MEHATLYQARQYASGIYYKDKSINGGKVLGIDGIIWIPADIRWFEAEDFPIRTMKITER